MEPDDRVTLTKVSILDDLAVLITEHLRLTSMTINTPATTLTVSFFLFFLLCFCHTYSPLEFHTSCNIQFLVFDRLPTLWNANKYAQTIC